MDDSRTIQLSWYHTSTYADWPPTIDFRASLSDNVRRTMGGDSAVDRWAHRQGSKALHIGSYESAIHNMLRRIRDQGDQGRQFYLYRVHLRSAVEIHPGWIQDPSNVTGDVQLDDVCRPEVEAVRYVNWHEDPGGLSLAIRRSAIAATQRVAIPLPQPDDGPWTTETIARLSSDSTEESRIESAAAALQPLVDRLPVNLRGHVESAAEWHAGREPIMWARYAMGLAALVEDPTAVLTELDRQALHDL